MWLPTVATQYNDGMAGMQTEDLSARMLHTDVYWFFSILFLYDYIIIPITYNQDRRSWGGGQYFAKGATHQSGPSNN